MNVPLLSPIFIALVFSLLLLEPGNADESSVPTVLGLLSSGDQKGAEARLLDELRTHPRNDGAAFISAVCIRSRFERNESAPIFFKTLAAHPNSLEGLTSACILGIDLAKDEGTALYYYNALLVLCRQHPDSIPTRWLAAIMSRTLTRERAAYELTGEVRERILQAGIREYEAVLTLMSPGPGPVLVHQTMANLLDESQGYDDAWRHREIALQMERAPWSLHSAAGALLSLERPADALPLLQEAIAMRPDIAQYYDRQGKIFWDLGRRREALNAWTRASQLAPNSTEYLNVCAWGFRNIGDFTAARECTKKSLAKKPKDRTIQILDAHLSVLLGEPGSVDRLLQAGQFDFQGTPVSIEPPTAQSDPWFVAASFGNLSELQQLIGKTDINARNPHSFHQTALMNAAQAGWETIVIELIRGGAKLDLADDNGDTALHYCAQFHQPRVMKLLLDAGAKTDLQDKWKQTPLISCISSSEWDGFFLLMAKKASITPATPHGGTALHYAAGHGKLAMVNALIAAGADVRSTNQQNRNTPLITACHDWAHSYLIRPLLAAGADVNACDKNGRSALHYAVDPLLNLPLVEMLLEKGADPTLADNNGTTPIAQARLLGFEEIALQMEKKSGHSEAFRFPQFEAPPANLSPEIKNASLFVLPILLAQGHPCGRRSGSPNSDKESARKELKWMFGIRSAARLQSELKALADFQLQYLEEPGFPSAGDSLAEVLKLVDAAATKIFASCRNGVQSELAWTQSHIIYMADLGVSAGFLEPKAGEKLISDASAQLKGRFSSWNEYLDSFLFGAQMNNGWEAKRYGHIAKRLLEAKLSWP